MPPKKYTIRLDNPVPAAEEKLSAIDADTLKRAESGHLYTPLPKKEDMTIEDLKSKRAMIEGNLSMPSYEKKKQLADLTFSIKIKEQEEREKLEELELAKKREAKVRQSIKKKEVVSLPLQTTNSLPEKELQKIKKRELKKYVKRLIVESSDSDTDEQSSSSEEEKVIERDPSPSKTNHSNLTRKEIKAIKQMYVSSSSDDEAFYREVLKEAHKKREEEKRLKKAEKKEAKVKKEVEEGEIKEEKKEEEVVNRSDSILVSYKVPSFRGVRRR